MVAAWAPQRQMRGSFAALRMTTVKDRQDDDAGLVLRMTALVGTPG